MYDTPVLVFTWTASAARNEWETGSFEVELQPACRHLCQHEYHPEGSKVGHSYVSEYNGCLKLTDGGETPRKGIENDWLSGRV